MTTKYNKLAKKKKGMKVYSGANPGYVILMNGITFIQPASPQIQESFQSFSFLSFFFSLLPLNSQVTSVQLLKILPFIS